MTEYQSRSNNGLAQNVPWVVVTTDIRYTTGEGGGQILSDLWMNHRNQKIESVLDVHNAIHLPSHLERIL